MDIREFTIGKHFYTPNGEYICTDVGTRTICAISADHEPANLAGPPYSVEEMCFDEYDMEGCEATKKEIKEQYGICLSSRNVKSKKSVGITWDEYKRLYMTKKERQELARETRFTIKCIEKNKFRNFNYTVAWDENDKIFVARCAEMPGLAAHGDTEKEAMQQIRQVAADSVALMVECGDTIPEPRPKRSA